MDRDGGATPATAFLTPTRGRGSVNWDALEEDLSTPRLASTDKIIHELEKSLLTLPTAIDIASLRATIEGATALNIEHPVIVQAQAKLAAAESLQLGSPRPLFPSRLQRGVSQLQISSKNSRDRNDELVADLVKMVLSLPLATDVPALHAAIEEAASLKIYHVIVDSAREQLSVARSAQRAK